MFNSVELVRDICRQQRIPVSKLEQDCGFSNGYLNPKKLTKIPYDRALVIAEYLGVSAGLILTGKAGAPEPDSRHDVLDDVDVAFYGDFRELDENDKETVRDMVRIMRERRAKKQEK